MFQITGFIRGDVGVLTFTTLTVISNRFYYFFFFIYFTSSRCHNEYRIQIIVAITGNQVSSMFSQRSKYCNVVVTVAELVL